MSRLFFRGRCLVVVAALCSVALGCGSFESKVVTPPQPAGDGPREVSVRVHSDRDVSLSVDQPRTELCRAPCTVMVDPAQGPFVAEVAGRPDSPTFELPPGVPALDVIVFPSATVLPGLAAVIGTVGLAAMGIGLTTLAADLSEVRSFDGTALAGGITALGGSAVLSVALTMWFLSGTHVIFETTPPAK